jgi:hypothetical protein
MKAVDLAGVRKGCWRNIAITLIARKNADRPQEMVAGFAQETAIRRTSEAFIGPKCRAGRRFWLVRGAQVRYNATSRPR